MVTNTKNVDEPYCRSTLRGSENLPELKRCGSHRRLSGPSQGDAAAELMKTRGATAAAVAELGQRSDGARRKKGDREARRVGLLIRRAHKAGARIKETVAWLSHPPRRLDFRDDS